MSIASDIIRIKDKVSDSFSAVDEKNGTLPLQWLIENLPESILTIPSSVNNSYEPSEIQLSPEPAKAQAERIANEVINAYLAVQAKGGELPEAWKVENLPAAILSMLTESFTHSIGMPLTQAKFSFASASIGLYIPIGGGQMGGKYALFAGGNIGNGVTASVNAYDDLLTRSTPTALSTGRYGLQGMVTADNGHALIAGGLTTSGVVSSRVATVDTYSALLVKGTATNLSQARYGKTSAIVGNYTLFIGGGQDDSTSVATVDAYNTSLTRSTPTVLSQARRTLAMNVGDYALCMGGKVSGTAAGNLVYTDRVDAYDDLLTRTIITPLSQARYVNGQMANVTRSNFAIAPGGQRVASNAVVGSDVVEVYDDTLVKTIIEPLFEAKFSMSIGNIKNIIMIAGGSTATEIVDTVEAYNETFTKIILPSLSTVKNQMQSATVGNHILFAGGRDGNNNTLNTVEMYQLTGG